MQRLPRSSSSAYLLDGLFIGALNSQIMRNAMIQSLLLYLLFWWLLRLLAIPGCGYRYSFFTLREA